MRISNNMGYSTFSYNIAKLQEMSYKDNLRQATGKEMISISDSPVNLMDLKKINAAKAQRENYININDLAIVEMRSAEDQANSILDGLQQIRDLSIGSTNPAYDGGVAAVATFVKGIITDIIRNANADFNGKYLFSGTKTNSNSIEASNLVINGVEMNGMPFELVEDTPTPDNPSGLRVVFKGNIDNRTINKDTHSSELINLTAEDLFGAGGVAAFQPLIEIYNKLMYTRDGEKRTSLDTMDREEVAEISRWQQQVALDLETAAKNISAFASRRTRLETITLQMKEEVTRLNEVKSLREDADMSKVIMNLMKEETALQYTLQSASKLTRSSLFDFLN